MKKKAMIPHRSVFTRLLLTAILMALCGHVYAQTVSISPKTGNVISAASYGNENHMQGYGGTWVHDQLPLTWVTSDEATLTDAGLLKVHANNIAPLKDRSEQFVICGGTSKNGYFTLSLPKGYRFTSYKMVLTNNVTTGSMGDFSHSLGGGTYTIYEKDRGFARTIKSQSLGQRTTTGTPTEYTLQRTSTSTDDMGNVLYFELGDVNNYYVAAYIKSFVVTFECTSKFGEVLRPAAVTSGGVDCVALPFATERVDLGQITRQTVKDYTSYKYNYGDVKDLSASFLLYDADGIVGGKAVPEHAGSSKSIRAMKAGDGLIYVGLANGTYWLETPTEGLSSDGKTMLPVGYRIVGARLVYANTSAASVSRGMQVYIRDGQGRYMNSSLSFTTTPVTWTYDSQGRVYTTSGRTTTYLRHESGYFGFSHTLTTTTKQNSASTFATDGQTLYYVSGNSHYVISYSGSTATYNVSGQYATVTGTQPVQTGVSYQLALYDKTGETVAASAQVDDSHAAGSIEAGDYNNDAIKFTVSGLADGQTASLCLEVELEALNPYIDKMDIVCTQPDGSRRISNQYLADDFTIGVDGKVDFTVPRLFGEQGLVFTFEGLNHKKADTTYGPYGSEGEYSRYHFVRSAYYDLIGESLQSHRAEAADHDYRDKIAVSVAGNQAFRCNNSSEFAIGTTGNGSFYYTETRYTNTAYAAQGGTWSAVTADAGDDYRGCYLAVCDETRYNIAPTTQPRHAFYAFYSTHLRLQTEDYEPTLTYTTVYDHAMLAGGYDDKSYVGAAITLRRVSDGQTAPDGEGYIYAKQIADRLSADIAAGVAGAPSDTRHVLYLDASRPGSVLFGEAEEWGSIATLQSQLGDNAMIYLPKGVTLKANNVATRSIDGADFVADNDIVLTDKLPFFAPYDIRVDAANSVTYTRQVTPATSGDTYLTAVLPFTVAIDPDGQYAGEDGTVLTFHRMAMTDALDNIRTEDGHDYRVTGHFAHLTDLLTTEANKPYLILAEGVTGDDGLMTVTVAQHGATIARTAAALEGETATATMTGAGSVSLTHYGTFCGEKIDKTLGVFYMSRSALVSSRNLVDRYPDVYVMPFRTWYTCEGAVSGMRYIDISTEPGSGTTAIDGITDTGRDTGLAVTASAGAITVTAHRDMTATVRTPGGQTVAQSSLIAGESRRFDVAPGLYLVGGRKVLVTP